MSNLVQIEITKEEDFDEDLGNCDDLLKEEGETLEGSKLGWNLPVNDTTKSGKLDSISVDSYWIDDVDINEIQTEKSKDPVNTNYNTTKEKSQQKYQEKINQEKNNSK